MTTHTSDIRPAANSSSRLLRALWGVMVLTIIAAGVAFLLDDPLAQLLRGLGLVFLGVSLLVDSRHYRATQDTLLRWTFITIGVVTLLSGIATSLHDILR
jgi:hypothetical protein